jgi:putative (di)nucleoside polyphosphate hydrolase
VVELGYRPCVGVMLVNADGKVCVGRRIDNKEGDWWQMPQGGVDPGEDLTDAVMRELYEETGVSGEFASIIRHLDEPLRYDLPEHLIGKLWDGKYRGQEQTWFLVRFSGEDEHVNLEAHDPPEFCDYRWVDPEELPDLIIPFKKRVYRTVLESFRELI